MPDSDEKRRDEVLKRMLATKPTPHDEKKREPSKVPGPRPVSGEEKKKQRPRPK